MTHTQRIYCQEICHPYNTRDVSIKEVLIVGRVTKSGH